MAVRTDGRHAVTRLRVIEQFGPPERPLVSLLECQLQTGRTHQIRVHATHIGHALVGDPVYGRVRAVPHKQLSPEAVETLRGFPRQALHAARLGFRHPTTGNQLRFESPLPADIADVATLLRN